MIDKAISTITKQPDPSANVKDEVSRAQQVSGGLDKFKKRWYCLPWTRYG